MTARDKLEGTAFVARSRFLYVGPLAATERHAHHATQVVVAPDGLDIEDAARGKIHAQCAVIPPHVTHSHGACRHAALLFIDGDDVASRALKPQARCEKWARDLDLSDRSLRVPRAPSPREAQALVAAILAAVAPSDRAEPQHPAVRRMCALLDGAPDDVDLAALSEEAGLSARQMRHAFARDVGISMRAYLRWRRLRRAFFEVEGGASLTEAAARAGFADSAHLTRVCREQFGITPTQTLSAVTWRTLD